MDDHSLDNLRRAFKIAGSQNFAAYILADDRGDIIEVNQAAAQMFGYYEDEMRGMNITELMPEEFRELHQRAIKRLITQPTGKLLGQKVSLLDDGRQLRGKRKDGSEFPVTIFPNRIEEEGQFFLTSVIEEVVPILPLVVAQIPRRVKFAFVMFCLLILILSAAAVRNWGKGSEVAVLRKQVTEVEDKLILEKQLIKSIDENLGQLETNIHDLATGKEVTLEQIREEMIKLEAKIKTLRESIRPSPTKKKRGKNNNGSS